MTVFVVGVSVWVSLRVSVCVMFVSVCDVYV